MNKVFKLIDFSEKEKEEYMRLYDKFLSEKFIKPEPFFNELGLRYPVDHLNEILGIVIFLPIELMAEYVDAVTKDYVDNNQNHFLSEIYSFDIDYNNANTTSVGNLAYINMHCSDQVLKRLQRGT